MANQYTDKMKQTAETGKEAAEAVGGVFKNVLVGGKNKASNAVDAAGGAIGGIAGFAKGIADTAFNIANGAANVAFKVVKKFPRLSAGAVVIGGAIGVKNWMDNREKNKELDVARSSNELMETKIANDMVQAHLESGKPVFENPEARADFVKKYAEQQRVAQQSAGR